MSTVLKCKMCGGDIEIQEGATVAKCKYCGSVMTIPLIDSDKKARLFNRANEYRLNAEFDKAYEAYKSITEEEDRESEAYWGMVLSEYGVEYIEDPSSGKRIPTCHRTLSKSVLSSVNYELARKYADAERKMIYQDEAEEIDRIQKSILSVSATVNPYDVFICYKETDDETGERTEDSLLGYDLYKQLTNDGYRVFFSRVTLAEKLGEDYEPYIYSALRSARIMLVVGTTNSNLNAVWVKNEWSRFLHFMDEDRNKVIIPVYKNISIEQLPPELSKFQGQDLGKVGALQDIELAVKKLLAKGQTEQNDVALNSLIQDKIKRDEKRAKSRKLAKRGAKIVVALCVAAVIVFLILTVSKPARLSAAVKSAVKAGNYSEALNDIVELTKHGDNNDDTSASLYESIARSINSEGYIEAIKSINDLSEYKNSSELTDYCAYHLGLTALDNEEYDWAVQYFELADGYEDSKDKIAETLYQRLMSGKTVSDKVFSTVDCLSDEQLYEVGKKYCEESNEHALDVLRFCINYKDSMTLYADFKYDQLVQDDGKNRGRIVEMKKLATGELIKKAASDADVSNWSYPKAEETFQAWCKNIYDSAKGQYNQFHWGSAKAQLDTISGLGYLDTDELIEICENNIAQGKAKYEGVWIESTGFWTDLKIQDGNVYAGDGDGGDWTSTTSEYNEDTGELFFTYFEKYSVSVNGNTLTITCLDAGDDWFGSYNKFYRE